MKREVDPLFRQLLVVCPLLRVILTSLHASLPANTAISCPSYEWHDTCLVQTPSGDAAQRGVRLLLDFSPAVLHGTPRMQVESGSATLWPSPCALHLTREDSYVGRQPNSARRRTPF